MNVFLTMLGCRLNQGEIDVMARQFAAQGHTIAEAPEKADVIVVNTCAVTAEAARSSRQTIYRAGRANPEAQIVVTGCYAHIAPDAIRTLPGVAHVIDNLAKESLASIVTGQTLDTPAGFDQEPIAREASPVAGARTRAFVKVQDGCDQHCTFCVTRLARGVGRSRPLAAIVDEVRALGAAGYREIVLTGVHLGSYGHDQGQADGLYHLLRAILDETDMPRVRLSSLEPWGIPAGFFRLWANPRLCRHLHLPLQSGCDATLRRMARRTSQAAFRAVVDEARAHIPDVALTTDVIVGFPGETDAEFAISRAFVELMDFAGMHVFRYSRRPGTAAARLPGQVDEAVKKSRAEALQAIARRGEAAFAARFAGTTRPVLWEGVAGTTGQGFVNHGYTDNYLRVRHVTSAVLTNQITATRLIAFDPQHGALHGELQPAYAG